MTIGLGALRFVLAMFVAVTHLWDKAPHGFAAYAVWGFFVLSGFLMTSVLLDKYGLSRRGLVAYAVNRFLRIFPPYYLAAILGVFVVLLLRRSGIDPTSLNPEFGLPSAMAGWLFPVTLLPIFQREAMPIAVANALGIEVGFYVLMPLMASRKYFAWAFFALGLGFVAYYRLDVQSFAVRYSTFWPCCLAFSLGALVAHYRDGLRRFAAPWAAVIVWCVHSLVWFRWPSWPWTAGIYVASLLCAWIVVSFHVRRQSALDQRLGDLSYPIYLLHTVCGGFVMLWDTPLRGALFAVLSLALTLVVAWVFVSVVDRPLRQWKLQSTLPQK